ncbi:MAG: hypothetical protein JO182_27440, partial [Acidobacteriaceae bacterium]|nr:hypothetical protein [Acidobacteriaceae bacterium]
MTGKQISSPTRGINNPYKIVFSLSSGDPHRSEHTLEVQAPHLPYEYANMTDVPIYSGNYPSVLASSGVKYWVAANNDRVPIFYFKQWNEQLPFWWEGPDGKRVLFWYFMEKPFGLMLEALDDLRAHEVYVNTGSSPRNALWGELMSIRARRLGASGAVLNGYSRDTSAILNLDFPTFSWGRYGQDA